MEPEVGPSGDPSAKKRRKTSCRCIVYGCGNKSNDGFFLHELPGKMPSEEGRFDALQRRSMAGLHWKEKKIISARCTQLFQNFFV